MVNPHWALYDAAPTLCASIKSFRHLVDVLIREVSVPEQLAIDHSSDSEVPAVDPKQQFRAITGHILRVPGGFVDRTHARAAATLCCDAGIHIQEETIVAMLQNCREYLQEASRPVLEHRRFHVKGVLLIGCLRDGCVHYSLLRLSDTRFTCEKKPPRP